jgi:meiotic recombination protein SPO11
MDNDLLNLWKDASSSNSLLPDSQYSKLISQNQLATSSLQDHTDSQDSLQGARRNINLQAGEVITKIEDIFESLLDCIINEKKCLVLHIKSRARNGRHTIDAATGAIRNAGNVETKEITFPGKTQKETWKFGKCFSGSIKGWQILILNLIAALLRILELSHEALVTGIVTTKR